MVNHICSFVMFSFISLSVCVCVFPALGTICEEAGDVIDNGDASAKREKRNTLKMWTYLAFQLLEAFENDVTKPVVVGAQEKVRTYVCCHCFRIICTFGCVAEFCNM